MVKSSGYLKLTGSPYGKNQASISDQERNPRSVMTNESHDIHQRPYPDRGAHTSQSNQEGSSDVENHRQTPESVLSIIPEGGSDQENFLVPLRPEKVLDKLPLRRNPDSGVHVSHSDQGVTISKLPEKPTVDGYNWRKYGQKLVRGNTFVRSYYKCTNANCPARKQVERSHDGQITEINYLWKHEHPKPPLALLKSSRSETSQDPEASDMDASRENVVEVAVLQSAERDSDINNIPPDSKRQKKESASFNDSVVTKTNYEPRVVIETTSAVDIVNDGYRWRKYGQKLVKGNPNPRSYYRCSNVGCPVKKHVERAWHNEKVVITTYEGRHDHEMPAGFRNVTLNTLGNNNDTASDDDDDDESTPRQEANESRDMEMVVHVGAN